MSTMMSHLLQILMRKIIGLLVFLLILSSMFEWLVQMRGLHGHESILSVIYLMPRNLYLLWPLVLLIAPILTVIPLAESGYFTLIQSSGRSLRRMIITMLAWLFILSSLVFVLGQYLVPQTNIAAKQVRSQHLSSLPPGGFQFYSDQRFWLIQSTQPKIEDITIYQVDADSGISDSWHAQSAKVDGQQWVLEDVTHWDWQRGQQHDEAQIAVPAPFDMAMFQASQLKTNFQTLSELYRSYQFIQSQQWPDQMLAQAFYSRLQFPFTCLLMSSVMIWFMIGSYRAITIGTRVRTLIPVMLLCMGTAQVSIWLSQCLSWPPFVALWLYATVMIMTVISTLLFAKRMLGCP